jgi:hypothetical protein
MHFEAPRLPAIIAADGAELCSLQVVVSAPVKTVNAGHSLSVRKSACPMTDKGLAASQRAQKAASISPQLMPDLSQSANDRSLADCVEKVLFG